MEFRRSPHPFILSSLLPLFSSLFFAFRLVYIPAAILSHTGHGLPWLNAFGALVATFGLEGLSRRGRRGKSPNGSREVWLIALALALVGLFPEEAPIGVILWAAIGAAWGRLDLGSQRTSDWAGLLGGGLLGLTGLVGPGSWLMAVLLVLWRSEGFGQN